MEERQTKSTIILKYSKRRYDGGSEAELIRTIEHQKDVAQMQKMYQGQQNSIVEAEASQYNVPLTLSEDVLKPKPDGKVKRQKSSRLWETALMGPLQVCVGIVGMLTAALAITTFRKQNNEVMLKQSQLVMNDCFKTLQKGALDTLTTPVRMAKVFISQKG